MSQTLYFERTTTWSKLLGVLLKTTMSDTFSIVKMRVSFLFAVLGLFETFGFAQNNVPPLPMWQQGVSALGALPRGGLNYATSKLHALPRAANPSYYANQAVSAGKSIMRGNLDPIRQTDRQFKQAQGVGRGKLANTGPIGALKSAKRMNDDNLRGLQGKQKAGLGYNAMPVAKSQHKPGIFGFGGKKRGGLMGKKKSRI